MRSDDRSDFRQRARAALDRFIGGFLATLLAAMVLDVGWQILGRFVLGAPSAWTEELARFLLVWLGLFGAAYTFGRRQHLAVDLLPGALSAASAHRLRGLTDSLVALFALAVLTIGGTGLVTLVADLGQRSAALGVPLAWVYAALPASGLLTLAYAWLGPPTAVATTTETPEG